VFIVDEAHMITTQGFNALLKIVEEPPEHLVFVFATTEPEKVLPTIRSRTHHYPFRLIPPGTLRKLLERICADEEVTVAPAVYPLVIRAGGGSARDSLSVLDQLVAGAGPEGVTYERAVALLGVTDVSLIDDVVDALAAGDRAAVFEAVDRLVEAGHDPRRFATDLLQRLRDLTLLQAVPEAVERGLVEAADDEIARMVEQSGKFGAATLTRYGEILHVGLTEMRGATAPRLLLELLCARMLLPAATTEEPGLLERLERLERRSAIAASPPAPGESGAPSPSAAADTSVPVGGDRSTDRADGVSYSRRSTSVPSVTGGLSPASGGSPSARAASSSAGEGMSPESGSSSAADGGPHGSAEASRPTEPAAGGPPPASDAPTAAAGLPNAPAASSAAGGVPRAPVARSAGDAHPPASATGGPPPVSGAPTTAGGLVPGASSSARASDSGVAGRRVDGPSARPPAPNAAAGGEVRENVAAVGAADVRRVWQEIQEAVKQRKKRTAALLVSATVRAVENDTLVLSIGTAPLARLLSEQSNTDVIAEALHAVLGVRWRVRCEHGDGSAPRAQEARQVPRAAGSGPAGRTPQAAGQAPDGPPSGEGEGAGGSASAGRPPVGGQPSGKAWSRAPGGGPPSSDAPGGPAAAGRSQAANGRQQSGAAQASGGRPAGRVSAREDGVPLPPEPPEEDTPPDDEEAMLAELDAGPSEQQHAPARSDPEEAAIALLTSQLGARAIDRR
jgi:DNA polymerase III subunit gamma/tau